MAPMTCYEGIKFGCELLRIGAEAGDERAARAHSLLTVTLGQTGDIQKAMVAVSALVHGGPETAERAEVEVTDEHA